MAVLEVTYDHSHTQGGQDWRPEQTLVSSACLLCLMPDTFPVQSPFESQALGVEGWAGVEASEWAEGKMKGQS